MEMEYNRQKRCLIVKVTGELDHHSAVDVREHVDHELTCGQAKNLIFDFADLEFMDSSGIGVVIGRYKMVTSMGGKVAIAGAKPGVDRILLLSGIHKIMPVAKNISLALEAI